MQNRSSNRRQFLIGSGSLVVGCASTTTTGLAEDKSESTPLADMASYLRRAGVWEVAAEIGLDADAVFRPLARRADHPYRLYRWSVSYAETGGPLIQALPPEEEMGWMPWEEWLAIDGKPVRRSMVLYPVREMKARIPLWWCLETSRDLTPRRATPAPSLEALFRRDRIIEAAEVLGMDAVKTLLEPLSAAAEHVYRQMRWTVAPHRLAADLPVIQCLPPAGKGHEWPWETWYTDGKVPLIHHVHYAVPNDRTHPSPWRERDGAPQRPAELFGVEWHWYNDRNMAPALAQR